VKLEMYRQSGYRVYAYRLADSMPIDLLYRLYAYGLAASTLILSTRDKKLQLQSKKLQLQRRAEPLGESMCCRAACRLVMVG